jgi:nitroreductase
MDENVILKTIEARRSNRSFKPDEPLDERLVGEIIRAGQYAPYVSEGSRLFTVLNSRSLVKKMGETAKKAVLDLNFPGLVENAKDETYDPTYGAPLAVLISGDKDTNGFESACSASAENMLIAAESLKISSCWVFYLCFAFMTQNAEELKTKLSIPEGFSVYAGVLLGYKSGDSVFSEARYLNEVKFIKEGQLN